MNWGIHDLHYHFFYFLKFIELIFFHSTGFFFKLMCFLVRAFSDLSFAYFFKLIWFIYSVIIPIIWTIFSTNSRTESSCTCLLERMIMVKVLKKLIVESCCMIYWIWRKTLHVSAVRLHQQHYLLCFSPTFSLSLSLSKWIQWPINYKSNRGGWTTKEDRKLAQVVEARCKEVEISSSQSR